RCTSSHRSHITSLLQRAPVSPSISTYSRSIGRSSHWPRSASYCESVKITGSRSSGFGDLTRDTGLPSRYSSSSAYAKMRRKTARSFWIVRLCVAASKPSSRYVRRHVMNACTCAARTLSIVGSERCPGRDSSTSSSGSTKYRRMIFKLSRYAACVPAASVGITEASYSASNVDTCIPVAMSLVLRSAWPCNSRARLIANDSATRRSVVGTVNLYRFPSTQRRTRYESPRRSRLPGTRLRLGIGQPSCLWRRRPRRSVVDMTRSRVSAAFSHSFAQRRSTGTSARATSSDAPSALLLILTSLECGIRAACASARSLPGQARSANMTALVISSRDIHHGGATCSGLSRTRDTKPPSTALFNDRLRLAEPRPQLAGQEDEMPIDLPVGQP